MATYLLALDQASQTTGYSLWKGKDLIKSGTVSFSDNDYMKRIVRLRKWLGSMLDEYKDDISVVLEDIQLQTTTAANNVGLQTYKKLAHVQGALLSLLVERQIDYQIVLASSWRHTCGIKGNQRKVQKANAQTFALAKYNLKVSEDEADAVCIGYHAIHSGATSVSAF